MMRFNFPKLAFLTFAFLLLFPATLSYTQKSGTISASETWGQPDTDQTIYVSGSVYFEGETTILTILPGTVVKFRPGNSVNFQNGATVSASGENANLIHFTSCRNQLLGENLSGLTGCSGSPSKTDVGYGLRFYSSSGASQNTDFSFLTFSWCEYGIRVENAAIGSVHDCYFDSSKYGISSYEGTISGDIYSSYFYNSITGLSNYLGEISGNIYGNVFIMLSNYGIYNSSGTISGGVYENGFLNIDKYAIYNKNSSVSGEVRENVFGGLGEIGIRNEGSSSDFSGGISSNTFSTIGEYGIYNWEADISGDVCNNLFEDIEIYAIYNGKPTASIAKIFNNTFSRNGASHSKGAGIRNYWSAKISNIENNIFSENRHGIHIENGTIGPINYNAYYNNTDADILDEDPADGYPAQKGPNYIDLDVSPFLGAGSEPYLLNSQSPGGLDLVDSGSGPVALLNGLNQKTTDSDTGCKDAGIVDIGYHYPTANTEACFSTDPPTANANVPPTGPSNFPIQLSGTCSDTDGTIQSCAWSSDNPDKCTIVQADTSDGFGSEETNNGTIECDLWAGTSVDLELIAEDNDGAVGFASATLAIVDNSPPIAQNVEVSPAEPKTSNNLSCIFLYVDPDDDPPGQHLYRWAKDGTWQAGPSFENSSLSHTFTSEGEQWKCEVTPVSTLPPTDGIPVSSPEVTISSAPAGEVELEIVSITLNPENIVVGQTGIATLDVTAEARNALGDFDSKVAVEVDLEVFDSEGNPMIPRQTKSDSVGLAPVKFDFVPFLIDTTNQALGWDQGIYEVRVTVYTSPPDPFVETGSAYFNLSMEKDTTAIPELGIFLALTLALAVLFILCPPAGNFSKE